MKPRLKHTFLTNARCPKCGELLYTSDNQSIEFVCDKCDCFISTFEIKSFEPEILSIQIPITTQQYFDFYDEIHLLIDDCFFDEFNYNSESNTATVSWYIQKLHARAFVLPDSTMIFKAARLINQFMDIVNNAQKKEITPNKSVELHPKRKLLHEEYVCEITEKLTKILLGASDLYCAYICGTCTDRIMAIRVPGCTVGYIKLNEDNVITEAVVYDYALNRFEGDPNEILKQFIEAKLSYKEIVSK